MAYVIAEPCIGVMDRACVDVWPVDGIHRAEGSPQLYINPNDCINCGACEVVFPVQAIFKEGALPEKWSHCKEINRDFFRDR